MVNLNSIQKTIGYTFNNIDLLQQAFVRKSYSEENGGQNNEVLEFIGDKALDLAVIRIMMERFGHITLDKDYMEFKLSNPKYFQTKLDEGKFTDIKKDLVEKKALAKCMDKLGFNNFLIMGKGDIKSNIQEQDSVKEDLFEAILGAVTLDSNWNMDVITSVVETMIDFDDYFNNRESDSGNYIGKVQEWSQKNGYGLPEYKYTWASDYNEYYCILSINGIGSVSDGFGTSESKARMKAAEKFYHKSIEQEQATSEYEREVGEADYDRALAQINELVQKRMINKPNYEFIQNYDFNGNSFWTCKMSIEGIAKAPTYVDSLKKTAQKKCAYEMLLYLMGKIKK